MWNLQHCGVLYVDVDPAANKYIRIDVKKPSSVYRMFVDMSQFIPQKILQIERKIVQHHPQPMGGGTQEGSDSTNNSSGSGANNGGNNSGLTMAEVLSGTGGISRRR